MVDKYTQIMADTARKHDVFATAARQAIAISVQDGVPRDKIADGIGHGLHMLAVRSMIDVSAPNFAHEILLEVLEGVDWKAAAEAAFFTQHELN